MYYGSIDEEVLQHYGGLTNMSLAKVLDQNTDADDIDEVEIIHHSPYLDHNMMVDLLQNKRNVFSILSTNIQAIK